MMRLIEAHRWALSIRLTLATLYVVVVVGVPVAGFVVLTMTELESGPLPPEAIQSMTCAAIPYLVGFSMSAVSLIWSLFWRSPVAVRIYTLCWIVMLPVTALPLVLLGLGLQTGNPIQDAAAGAVICGSMSLPGATMLGLLLAIPLSIAYYVLQPHLTS